MHRGLLTEESADGHVITYMRVSYEGEGPFHESTRPIALGMDDGNAQPPGPSHEQVPSGWCGRQTTASSC